MKIITPDNFDLGKHFELMADKAEKDARGKKAAAKAKQAGAFCLTVQPKIGTYWLPITFGRYKGLTLPIIFFLDPGYIYWLRQDRVINKLSSYSRELRRQLKVVTDRANRILAPIAECKGGQHGKVVETQFVTIVDGNDVFERIVVTSMSSKPKVKLAKGSKIVGRSCVLRVSLVSDYRNAKLGYERMGRCLRETFCLPDLTDSTDGATASVTATAVISGDPANHQHERYGLYEDFFLGQLNFKPIKMQQSVQHAGIKMTRQIMRI